MARINEKEFEGYDPNNPNYSSLEYDLYARLQMSIRKNLVENCFEIYHRPTGEVIFSGKLKDVVKKANELEGEENTLIKLKIGTLLQNRYTGHIFKVVKKREDELVGNPDWEGYAVENIYNKDRCWLLERKLHHFEILGDE